MISGTSRILSKYGPVALLIITKMLQRVQEKSWNILEKCYLCQDGIQKNKSEKKSDKSLQNMLPLENSDEILLIFSHNRIDGTKILKI